MIFINLKRRNQYQKLALLAKNFLIILCIFTQNSYLKISMRAPGILVFLLFLLANPAFSQAKNDRAEGKFLIGFSQCTTADAWRRSMDLEMQNELLYYPNLQLMIKDAGNSSKNQVNACRSSFDA